MELPVADFTASREVFEDVSPHPAASTPSQSSDQLLDTAAEASEEAQDAEIPPADDQLEEHSLIITKRSLRNAFYLVPIDVADAQRTQETMRHHKLRRKREAQSSSSTKAAVLVAKNKFSHQSPEPGAAEIVVVKVPSRRLLPPSPSKVDGFFRRQEDGSVPNATLHP
jgi:hypothetical protein